MSIMDASKILISAPSIPLGLGRRTSPLPVVSNTVFMKCIV
jgi:hypothetical protein